MAHRELKFGSRRIKLPASRIARLGIGGALVVGGLLGFLPVLGFWMIPLGLLVISYDIAVARKARRKLTLWWHRGNGKPTAKQRNDKARAEKSKSES